MVKKKRVRKYEKIKEAHKQMMIISSICLFIAAAGVVPLGIIGKQIGYNHRLIAKKEEARQKLNKNYAILKKLSLDVNALRTDKMLKKNTINDEQNPVRVITDALPDRANSVALGSSFTDKIFTEGAAVKSMTPTPDPEELDDESSYNNLSYNKNLKELSEGKIPFSVELIGKYGDIKTSLERLERTIRPIQVNQLELKSSKDAGLTIDIDGQTFFQKKQDFVSLIQERTLKE